MQSAKTLILPCLNHSAGFSIKISSQKAKQLHVGLIRPGSGHLEALVEFRVWVNNHEKGTKHARSRTSTRLNLLKDFH